MHRKAWKVVEELYSKHRHIRAGKLHLLIGNNLFLNAELTLIQNLNANSQSLCKHRLLVYRMSFNVTDLLLQQHVLNLPVEQKFQPIKSRKIYLTR